MLTKKTIGTISSKFKNNFFGGFRIKEAPFGWEKGSGVVEGRAGAMAGLDRTWSSTTSEPSQTIDDLLPKGSFVSFIVMIIKTTEENDSGSDSA